MLERILTVKDVAKNPSLMFLIGGIASVLCLLVSALIFTKLIGWFTSFLVTLVITPLVLGITRYEEARDGKLTDRRRVGLFARYRVLIEAYVAFFLGVIISLSVLYVILPMELVNLLFADQMREIELIRGGFALIAPFWAILLNNLGVLGLCFAFSFLFGAGAVFILTWNASVLATAIGMTARQMGGLLGLPAAILAYFPHGSLEITAYFIAGIAGGLVSAAMTRKRHPWFWVTMRDSINLFSIAALLLVLAALVESFALVL